jgi:YihY family inner membrane protein
MTRRRTGNERPVTTASSVPVTREEELEGDEALETLVRTGRLRLALDAVARFRAADGFSHSRALAFQITLAILPGIIAVVGLAATLDVDAFTRVVRDTIHELAPGAVGEILTDALQQGTAAAREDSGETALVGGALAAAIAGTTAMAQVERGANRIYGTERDRPFLRKYLNAALLAATAGTLAVASAALLVGGSAIRSALGWGDTFDAIWTIARWPVGAALTVASVALLFERAPRRRQPEASWLAVGAVIAAVLWLAFMAALTVYVDATRNFGATYGPIAGTIGLLLWAMLSAVALFGGLAVAAQLEAVRAGVPQPRVERDEKVVWRRSAPGLLVERRAVGHRFGARDPVGDPRPLDLLRATRADVGGGRAGLQRRCRVAVVPVDAALRRLLHVGHALDARVSRGARVLERVPPLLVGPRLRPGDALLDVASAALVGNGRISVRRCHGGLRESGQCLLRALPGHPNANAYAEAPGATANDPRTRHHPSPWTRSSTTSAPSRRGSGRSSRASAGSSSRPPPAPRRSSATGCRASRSAARR